MNQGDRIAALENGVISLQARVDRLEASRAARTPEPEDIESLLRLARSRSARVCWSFLSQLRRELRANY